MAFHFTSLCVLITSLRTIIIGIINIIIIIIITIVTITTTTTTTVITSTNFVLCYR